MPLTVAHVIGYRTVARVVVDQDFTQPLERVFAYLSEHEHLGPLFGAKVTRLRDGTDGQRNGVGSVRRLKVGPLPPFEETVTEFVPDDLIRYRITKGSPLRDHEGVMRFSRNGGGAHLHYEISFGAVVPGLDRVIAAGLRRNISAGLKKVDSSA
jgi:uncharacterized protein YndB with AHSA1/START domain